MGTEKEGQQADVTTPRTEEAQTGEKVEEANDAAKTEEQPAETAGDTSGLDNEALQAGAEPEKGSEVDE